MPANRTETPERSREERAEQLRSLPTLIAHLDSVLAAHAQLAADSDRPSEARVVFARPSDGSDVFAFVNAEREGECAGCLFVTDGAGRYGDYVSPRSGEFIAHLRKHRREGHVLPDGVENDVAGRWAVAMSR